MQLVTNDLNMLLKAQTLGVPVARYGEGVEGGFARRYIIRPAQRYKTPLIILAVALGVFAAVLVVVGFAGLSGGSAGVPNEFSSCFLTAAARAPSTSVPRVQPSRRRRASAMGDFYSRGRNQAQAAGNRAAEFQYSRQGIKYYDRYLDQEPQDDDATRRPRVAALLLRADRPGHTSGRQRARIEPNHINGNFNLGIFYWQGRRDLDAARDQMFKVINLTENDAQQHGALSAPSSRSSRSRPIVRRQPVRRTREARPSES